VPAIIWHSQDIDVIFEQLEYLLAHHVRGVNCKVLACSECQRLDSVKMYLIGGSSPFYTKVHWTKQKAKGATE
jgi:hypothetical protein